MPFRMTKRKNLNFHNSIINWNAIIFFPVVIHLVHFNVEKFVAARPIECEWVDNRSAKARGKYSMLFDPMYKLIMLKIQASSTHNEQRIISFRLYIHVYWSVITSAKLFIVPLMTYRMVVLLLILMWFNLHLFLSIFLGLARLLLHKHYIYLYLSRQQSALSLFESFE